MEHVGHRTAGDEWSSLCLRQEPDCRSAVDLWRDIDLTAGHIQVREAKTAAGVRQIDLLPTLRDVLSAHKGRVPNASPDSYVFSRAPRTPE
jgi:hypothetical protein